MASEPQVELKVQSWLAQNQNRTLPCAQAERGPQAPAHSSDFCLHSHERQRAKAGHILKRSYGGQAGAGKENARRLSETLGSVS